MLQDFEANRPPEIDGLLTSVQQFARVAGVLTPQVDAVTALVIEKARRLGCTPEKPLGRARLAVHVCIPSRSETCGGLINPATGLIAVRKGRYSRALL